MSTIDNQCTIYYYIFSDRFTLFESFSIITTSTNRSFFSLVMYINEFVCVLQMNRRSRINIFSGEILNNMTLSLHKLPIDILYRIIDNLDDKDIFLSLYNVCQRLNDTLNTYHRYQVKNKK